MDDDQRHSSSSNGGNGDTKNDLTCVGNGIKKINLFCVNGADDEVHEQPSMKKNPDGTWGPTGLYGGRVKETPLLYALRLAVKPSRLKRVEQVLQNRCQRVHCLFENLSDPANGAACLRTMEGFGLMFAHAVEAYEPFHVTGGVTINSDKVCFHFLYT